MINNRILAALITDTIAVIMFMCAKFAKDAEDYGYSKVFFCVGAFLTVATIVGVIVL